MKDYLTQTGPIEPSSETCFKITLPFCANTYVSFNLPDEQSFGFTKLYLIGPDLEASTRNYLTCGCSRARTE